MKYLFLLALSTTVLTGFANQTTYNPEDSDTVLYELISNNPNHTYFGGGVNYNIGISNYDMYIGGLGFNAKFYNKYLGLDIRAKRNFAGGRTLLTGRTPEVTSIYVDEPTSDFTANLSYFFYNKEAQNDIHVTLKRRGNTEYVTYVPGVTSKRFGLDLGMVNGSTFFNFNEYEFTYTGTGPDGNTYQATMPEPVTSYHDYTTLKVGVSKATVEGLVIKTDKFGRNETYSISKIYGQALFMVRSQLDDVFIEEFGGYYSQHSINDMERANIGVNIGYDYFVVGDKIDTGWAIELGIIPGPKTPVADRAMLNIGFQINFGKAVN